MTDTAPKTRMNLQVNKFADRRTNRLRDRGAVKRDAVRASREES